MVQAHDGPLEKLTPDSRQLTAEETLVPFVAPTVGCRLLSHGVVTRLVTRAGCEPVEAGAIPVRHPAGPRGRVERHRFPKSLEAGSSPAGDTLLPRRPERRGAGYGAPDHAS